MFRTRFSLLCAVAALVVCAPAAHAEAPPDATPPTDTTALPATDGGGWYAHDPVAVTLDATDDGSGVDAFEYRLDGSTPQTAADGGTVLVAGEGVHLLAHRARDVAGTWSSWTTDTVRIDTVAPARRFLLVHEDGADYHVYGSGQDRRVVRVVPHDPGEILGTAPPTPSASATTGGATAATT